MLGTIIGNIYGITLGMDVGTELISLDGSFDVFNDGKLEGLLLGGSLGYTGSKFLGSDECIKLISTDGKVVGTILGDFFGVTLGLDDETDMGSLDIFFDCFNDGNI